MRQDVYRVAFDEASAELNDILAKFDVLRLRKERIEKLVEALKPLVVSGELRTVSAVAMPTIPTEPPMAVREPVAAVPAAPPVAAAIPAAPPAPQQAATVEEAADPFARRVENVMGMSSAARDVREYSRLFNSGSR